MDKTQVSSGHYFDDKYDSVPRFASYWYQIDEIIRTKPGSVLEIGVGTGLVHNYLTKSGLDVRTLDLDPDLKPTYVGSVLEIPLDDDSIDTVGCFQVLEHLPFDKFQQALSELRRVARNRVLVSLPDVTRVMSVNIRLPGFSPLQFLVPVPRLRALIHEFDGQHYWEIGKKGYPLSRIESQCAQAGLSIVRTFRPVENSYHRFFELRSAAAT